MKQTLGTMFIAAALATALAGCGAIGAAPADGAQGDGAAPAGAPANPGQAGNGRMGPGVMGQVVSVDGSTLVLQNQRGQDQSTVNVALVDSTEILKQVAIQIGQVPVGELVSATGSQDGDVFTATWVQVGQAAGMGPGGARPDGAPPQGDAPPQGGDQSNDRQPPADGGPGQGRGDRVAGTVTQVSDDTITIKTSSDATVQVRLADGAQILQQVAGARADLMPGTQVMVTGDQTDSTVNASRIVIVPVMTQPQ